jgi:hypothetical protein
MTRDTLAATIRLLDRIARTDTRDAMRVAAYVRAYMHATGDTELEPVLRQWHEEYNLPWMHDASAALALLFN